MIAVLPFENLSEDKANVYFADGIQEEDPDALVPHRGLYSDFAHRHSVSKATAAHLPRHRETARACANDSKAACARPATKSACIVQLIDAVGDATSRGRERYDRELIDIFEVESDIAEKIAEALQAN